MSNGNSVEKISQSFLQNLPHSLGTLADEVNIGEDTVRKIVVEDLRKRKICSRFVPHSLTPEQKARRTAACRDLIVTSESYPDFFKCCIRCGPDEERILDVVPREDGARNSG